MAIDSEQWIDAMRFASLKHRDQRRKDAHQSPYINHPIEAAHLLAKVAKVTDRVVLIAALLHDTLEDTSTTPAEIERWFGADVRSLVEEVTDPPGATTELRRRRQLGTARTASPRARLVRLADKVANLGALPDAWGPDERRAYLTWMGEMASALAGTNAPLERLLAERLKRAWTAAHRPSVPASPSTDEAPSGVPLTSIAGDELLKSLHRLQRQLGTTEELVDLTREMLMALGIEPVRVSGSRPATARSGKSKRPRRFSDPRYVEMARAGIGSVHFTPGPRGCTLTSFDGSLPFPLPARLAGLLAALVAIEGCDPEGFPPFSTIEQIVERLDGATGRRADEHTVIVGLSRLREKLWATKRWSPMLIETKPRCGVRLRLRRTAP